MGRGDAQNMYNRRSKSIVNQGGPLSPAGAGPSSGTGMNFMINDTSATQLNQGENNEVVVVSPGQPIQPQKTIPAAEEQPAEQTAE